MPLQRRREPAGAKGVGPGVDGYTQKDFETIEAAVLESPRGRWFLDEFTRRNRAADTVMLLEAIRKLERGVAENSPHQVSDELAAGLRGLGEAIGAALSGIMQTQDVWGAVMDLPEDAADDVLVRQVRNALGQLSEVKRQIDGLLADRSDGNAPLTAENLNYFEGDESLFEPNPGPSPSLAVVGEENSGAAPVPAPKGDPRDRIVFIRRASSKETSIPLVDEADDDPVPAGQSQPGS